jgi:hypothetical protein
MDFIRQISIVQVSACFTAPLIAFADPSGYIKKYWMGPWLSDTQDELNEKWTGTDWSLAERYTGTAKILFVSMYYALLTPYSIFLSFIAFLLTFLIDRFLLLRRWKRVCMLDADVAVRLRQQALLAIATHLFVTMRFIYSWPMDEAYWNPNLAQYERVNKYPTISNMLTFSSSSDRESLYWQTEEQNRVFLIYKVTFCLIACFVFIAWILIPGSRYLYQTFCYALDLVGDAQGIPFSDIAQITAYEPLISAKAHGVDKTYLCSYTREMLSQHRPPIFSENNETDVETRVDLSVYIPDDKQKHVLSIVKYYGDELVELGRTPVKHQLIRRIDSDDEDTRIVNIEEHKEGRNARERGYQIKTTHEGVLTRVPEMTNPSMHPALYMKLAPRIVELGSGGTVISTAPVPHSNNHHDDREQGMQMQGFVPKKASFANNKGKKAEPLQSLNGREERNHVSSDPNRRFTAKPLYRQLYGLSSSESDSDHELGDDFAVRMSRVKSSSHSNRLPPPVEKKHENKEGQHRNNVASNKTKSGGGPGSNALVVKQESTVNTSSDLLSSKTVPTLKRSDSPPRGNFRQKKF